MKKRVALVVMFLVIILGSSATAGRLDQVKGRGKLVCGVNDKLPGFGFLESNGSYSGFDPDFCRGVAAAVFGDPKRVEFVPLTAAVRFMAIQSGEVDALFRNTTLTSTRDGELGVDFGPVVFYDGQGIMVRANSRVKGINDLDSATVCTNAGTTSEQNITDEMRKRRKKIKLLTYEDFDKVMAAFDRKRCDAATTDASGLASRRAASARPGDYKILPDLISKEPFAPVVIQNDSQWRDVVSWVVYTTIYAEELGITGRNLASFLSSGDPVVRRFLGIEGSTGKGFGLANDFTVNVIRAIGNYGEIFERNLGTKTKLGLPRGMNSLQHGPGKGLIYSPPFR